MLFNQISNDGKSAMYQALNGLRVLIKGTPNGERKVYASGDLMTPQINKVVGAYMDGKLSVEV